MLGSNELLLVLALAFILLGPNRVIELIQSLRKTTDRLTTELEEELQITEEKEEENTLVFHLEELRKRFIISLISIIPTTVLCFILAPKIIEFFRRPYGGKLIFISPPEAFIVNIKVAIAGGIALSFPVIAYQMWKFVAPGLYPKEKKIFLTLLLTSVVLFAAGVAFSYFVIIPIAFKFLLKFGSSWFEPMFTASKYFSFMLKLMIAFGIVFQMPIVILFLSVSGIVPIENFTKYRRHIWVASFVIGAVLTPPDVLSQVLMSLPLIMLFEISLILGKIFSPKSSEPDKTEEEESGNPPAQE